MSVTGEIIKGIYRKHAQYESKTEQDYLDDAALGTWLECAVIDTANATVGPVPVARVPYACRVKAIYVVSQNTIAASGTEYKTYTVALVTAGVARTAATGDTQAASLNGLVALVPKAMTLSTTSANLEAAAGDVISITLTDSAGTTSTLGQGLFFVLLERVYA